MGNILSTGTFDGTSDFDPGIGIQNITSVADQDIYVWKLDASGNFIWAKTMGGMTKEGGVALTSDAQGNAFIGGFFTGTVDFDPGIGVNNHSSLGNDDSFVLKLNSQGNLQWVNTMGGTGTDVTSSLALDANGALYSVGQFSGTVDFNAGPGTYTLSSSVINSFISKVDNQGNFKWTKQISGGQNAASSIAVDGNSNVYTTGYFFSSADFDPNTGVFNLTALGEEDIYIHKMSCGNVPEINVTSSNILLCEGNTATIIASGALTYTWNTSGTNPLVVSPTVTTNYQVSGSDANGCKSSVTITQSVTNCTSLETQDNTKKGFQINPNPNNGLMTLTLPINDEHVVTITILNTLGQTVYSEDSYLPQTILSIENLPNGIYSLNVFQNKKSHGMIKIIKQ
jgi:hypothetical protein